LSTASDNEQRVISIIEPTSSVEYQKNSYAPVQKLAVAFSNAQYRVLAVISDHLPSRLPTENEYREYRRKIRIAISMAHAMYLRSFSTR